MNIADVDQILVGKLVKEKPVISIIVPCYNSAKTVTETLNSIQNQSFENYEIFVIDDVSSDSDELNEALTSFYEKIIFVKNLTNAGVSPTRNYCSTKSKGKYIAFLDADDIWHKTYLEEQISYLENNDFDMVYCESEIFGNTVNAGKSMMQYNPARGGQITRQMLIEGMCHILPSGTLIKRSIFLENNGFDSKVLRSEDFHLWMRLLFNNVKIGYLRKVLFKFRITPTSGSGDSIQRIVRSKKTWQVLQNELDFTSAETKIIEKHLSNTEMEILRATGKYHIGKKEWKDARRCFIDSLKFSKKGFFRLLIVIVGLSICPNLLFKTFASLRSNELEYLPK
jgi:teichuronic acid biosynthesis glycosyltransferase TuaG